MRQDEQPQPPGNRPNPWTLTPGDAALGMAILILLYIAGVGYTIWYEVSRNTADSWQETGESIIIGLATMALSAATLAAAVVLGTKAVRNTVGRIPRPEKAKSTTDRED